jgi:hypothetical protein
MTDQEHVEKPKNKKVIFVLLLVFLLLWVILGISGFIMSIVCFKYSGSTSQKIIGLLLSILIGPFYWFYFFFSKTYCKASLF